RAIRDVKDELRINVELSSPLDFIPVPQVGRSAALAKAERGHAHDLEDIAAMIERDLIDSREVRTAFERIEPELYRCPAIDPPAFRRRVEHLFPEVTSPRLDR
ncbi:MAG: hypothetical protein RMM28_00580, partial [Thermoleophilia bacterium]|nr:hypothetical protein [Thermoleophilia bacterium]